MGMMLRHLPDRPLGLAQCRSDAFGRLGQRLTRERRPGTGRSPRREGRPRIRTSCTRLPPQPPRIRAGARSRRRPRRRPAGARSRPPAGASCGTPVRWPGAHGRSPRSAVRARWRAGGTPQGEDRGLEQPGDRIARPRRGVERDRVVTHRPVGGDRIHARHREQLATPLVEHCPDVEERLQARTEPAARAAHALGNRAHTSVARGCTGAECDRPRRSESSAERWPRSSAELSLSPCGPRTGFLYFLKL